MHETKIVFFGTDGQELTSRHLEALVEHKANIIALVSAPPGTISTTHAKKNQYEGINKTAQRLNIPVYSPRDPKDQKFVDTLKQLKADVYIVCGYQYYLTQEILNTPPLGSINFHSSLLPRHAGMHPGFWTIWYGDNETGLVVHHMDKGIDTGDIIYETRVHVEPRDTIDSLYNRIWKSSIHLVPCLLDDLDRRNLPRKPQDMSKYLYNYEIIDKDFELDFRQPAEVLCRRVAMLPGKLYFVCNKNRYYVEDCVSINEPVFTRNFRTNIPYVINDDLLFVTPNKFLKIKKVIFENKEIDPRSISVKE
ncbi:MAG TPA: formyltransferase family protein [Spirochaetota bacterium]|nr:formyltransferase family protein [Spirochaetota bacterium]